MNKKTWFDCVEQPSETGKKVLCQKNGDFYVAMRYGKHYVPMPFADHYFSSDLCFPETWQEIDFPEPYTGHCRISPTGYLSEVITMSECEVTHPKIYKEFTDALIASIGKLKRAK